MIIFYLLLWPRHSLAIPALLLLLGLILLLCRYRRTAGALFLISFPFLIWYGVVNWRSHDLPTGKPVFVEITTLRSPTDKAIIISDPDQIARLARPFVSTTIRTGRALVLSDYRITFRSADGSGYTYRLRRDGCILHDVPASAIQDVYLPQEQLPLDLLPCLSAATTSTSKLEP